MDFSILKEAFSAVFHAYFVGHNSVMAQYFSWVRSELFSWHGLVLLGGDLTLGTLIWRHKKAKRVGLLPEPKIEAQ